MLPARPTALAALAAGAGLVAAIPAAAAGGGATVVLREVAFHKPVTRIHPGQRVTWSWKDPYVSHNLHAYGARRFKGATERLTGTYSVRFTRAGTYRYQCTLHPGMKGSIVVK